MKRNLVVQQWGVGNLIQTEPLLRYLGGGHLLVNPFRGTKDLAPLFPDWTVVEDCVRTQQGYYDDVYICGPWLNPAIFKWIGKNIHTPAYWPPNGQWQTTEADSLLDMAAGAERENTRPRLPRLDGWPAQKSSLYVVISCGYNKHEPGWGFKNWPGLNQAIKLLLESGISILPVGTREERSQMFAEHANFPDWKFMDQVREASACVGYIGNDTGWAHICGAYDIPSAIYYTDPTRQDLVKNRPAASNLLQFGPNTSPEEAVNWLLKEIGNGRPRMALVGDRARDTDRGGVDYGRAEGAVEEEGVRDFEAR